MLNPADYAEDGSEHGHQVALFMWASQNFEIHPELRLMFAIPNGGQRNIIVASNLKAEGVKSGIPDIFLPVPRGGYHGLFVELKRPADKSKKRKVGKTEEDQDKIIAALYQQGYGVYVAIGWEKARDVIVAYLTQKG